MRRYWEIDQTFAQPSESLLKKNLKESVKKQKEKGNKLEPVVISGRAIAKSWWGKAWCDNLEHYADFASRLERGKRYVRTGTVIDLKIQKGKIIARVQGTRKTPYRVEIRISPLTEKKCEAILERCGKIETLERLLSGDFPDDMKELFQGEDGLFPQPSEISFQCSCPDWALMCKHVAAALYGVGARLDTNPALFLNCVESRSDGLWMWHLPIVWNGCLRMRRNQAQELWMMKRRHRNCLACLGGHSKGYYTSIPSVPTTINTSPPASFFPSFS